MRQNGNYHFFNHGNETMTLAFVEFSIFLKISEKFRIRNHNLVSANLWHSKCIRLNSHHFYHQFRISLTPLRKYAGNQFGVCIVITSKVCKYFRPESLLGLSERQNFLKLFTNQTFKRNSAKTLKVITIENNFQYEILNKSFLYTRCYILRNDIWLC